MSILKTRGESEGVFKWTDSNSGSAGEKISFEELSETLKYSLANIEKSKNKDFLRMEAVRNQHGDVVRLRIYEVNLDKEVDENLFFTDRETLLDQGANISKLYDVIKEAGISVIEKDS